MQDSVLPRGVGLRKPHVFSTIPLSIHPSFSPPFSSLLSPYFFLFPSFSLLLPSHSFLLSSHSWARRGAGVEWG